LSAALAWWHAWVLEKAEIRQRKGRMTFVGAKDPPGFDSAAVIYRPWPPQQSMA
jgi:hypothetical protein